jgi:hypothetical protein
MKGIRGSSQNGDYEARARFNPAGAVPKDCAADEVLNDPDAIARAMSEPLNCLLAEYGMLNLARNTEDPRLPSGGGINLAQLKRLRAIEARLVAEGEMTEEVDFMTGESRLVFVGRIVIESSAA